jgi:pimeloyl-ACP methyl ester carboxylesterase
MVVDIYPQPAGLLGSSATGVRGLAESLRGITATPEGRALVASVVDMFAPPAKEDDRSDSDVVARATHELALTDLGPELPRIRAPLTVVYASPEPAERAGIDRSYAVAYAGKRDAKLVRVDSSGHMIMFDQPERFQAALKSFLAGR